MADPKIKITADTSQAERQIEKLNEALAGIDSVASAAGKALAVVTAAAAAVGFAVSKTLDSVDELAKTSKQLGMTAADLQALRNSAALAGVGAEELTASFRRLQNNIGDAFVKGTGPAKDALDRLGISVNSLRGLGADQQFKRIADEISKIPDPAERAAEATSLLGKQGPRLLEAANEFERLRKEAEQLGIALTKYDTAAIEAAGDALSELKFIADGALQKAVAEIAPIILTIARNIKEAVMEAGGFDVVIRERLIPGIKLLAQVSAALFAIWAAAKIAALIAMLGKVILTVVNLAKAIRTVGIAAAAAQAIATGGLSAIATLTLGVAGALAASAAVGKVFDGILEQSAESAQEIKDAVDNTVEPMNDLANDADRLNDAVRKALEAFDDTVTKLQQSAQYQRDVLNLGAQEATVRKTIAEEAAKLQKVGLAITTDQENRLRGAIEEEASIKRQIQLRGEQAAQIEKFAKLQSPLSRALQEQDILNQSVLENKTLEEIRKARENFYLTDATARQTALTNAQEAVDKELRAVANKYNVLESLSQKNLEATIEIEQAKQVALELGYGKESELYKSLIDAKKQLDIDYTESRLKAEMDLQKKIEDRELQRINSILKAERSGQAAVLSTKDKAFLQELGVNERQKKIVNDRIQFEKKSEMEKAQFAIDAGAQMFSALGAQNKRAFEAAKAFNIANAIMNTYMAATKALATYPPPFNFIAAAAAIGMGLAQVAQIRSQQYSGRQLGGPVMGGQTYMVGEGGPELFTPNTTGSITRNSDLGGAPVNISFNIQANDAEGFDDLLIQRRGMIQQMVSDAITERGQRSIL